ncbi:hybrid sensor histidine kinase/response regulator [Trichocoleus sp. FACHB-90]|uniref:response regulator n=1 Tax=Cyanophyceae TaxID=3028117 RepID=UPI0016883534|nr:hybrid sensor histidine kinase/response regulator [Trichocoleus sp. FACHB-90]
MKKILVIEDEPAVRNNLLLLLKAEGFEFIGAENGDVGVKFATVHKPDLIICDIMMPDFDGYAVLNTLRQDQATAMIPFIFLTAKTDRADLRQGMQLGADDYLTKPFTRAELLEAIAIRLKKQEAVTNLQNKIQELQDLNVKKNDLLATVSHELRAPLANMKMMIQMLEVIPNEERKQHYRKLLEAECVREMDMVNNILDWQRLESEIQETSLETLILQYWLSNIIEPFQLRIEQRQQILKVNLPPHLPPITSDRPCLEQILRELVNNACKYTPKYGEISISVELNDCSTESNSTATVTFNISNQAEIRAAYLPKIFDKFYRVPDADFWKQGGSGLGLALVHQLVEKLEGTIQVKSSDGWTTFTVQIPTTISQ